MSVVGIDFGNQNCRIAVAHKGIVEVIANGASNRKTPCMVSFDGRERRLGEAASSGIMSNFKNTVTEVKRVLGRRWDQPEFQADSKHFLYTTSCGDNNQIVVEAQYSDKVEKFSPEQIAGSLFGCLRRITQDALDGLNVTDCVITVPPYFSDVMRRSVLDAANIAGLNVLRLMNETTAVALQYGILRTLPEKDPIRVMFLDVGHASLNVSLVSFIAGKLQVLGTASDRNLGGRNFDRALVEHMAAEILQKHNMDVTANPKAMLRLFVGAERCKRILSANSEAPWSVECIMNDLDVQGTIDRATFEEITSGLLDRVIAPVKQVLFSTKTDMANLTAIEVIGGSVRIPAIRQRISNFFGRPCSTTCDGDESVARGAALQCAMLSPSFRVREFAVHDVTPFAVEVGYGNVDGVIEDQNLLFTEQNQIPSVKMISFHRPDAFQLVARYKNPELLPPGSDPLIGRFVISGIPSRQDGKPCKTKVKVKIDLHGILLVSSAQALEEVVEEPKAAAAAPPSAAPAPAESSAEPMETGNAEDKAKPEASADAMDTTEEAAKPAAEQPASEEPKAAKPKRTVKRTELSIDAQFRGGLSSDIFQIAFEREVAMVNEDKVIADTAARRNDLEAYVYEVRDRLMADLADYVADDAKEKFMSQLDQMEDWLYTDEGYDSQKSVYVSRLDSLKSAGDPIVQRWHDAEHRDEHITNLKAAIGRYQAFAKGDAEEYAHIDSAKKQSVLEKCDEIDVWLAEFVSKQDRLAKYEIPVLTVSVLVQKLDELSRFADPIMKTQKPKPKPKPQSPEKAKKSEGADAPAPESAAPADDEANRADAASAAAASDERMVDVDEAGKEAAAAACEGDEPAMQVD